MGVGLDIIKFAILACLVIFAFILYRRKQKEEGFQNASDELPVDADNPDLTESSYFGVIPAAASISIAKKRQGIEATNSVDTNANGAPQVALLEVPDSAIPPDDIEVLLEKEAAGKEGFQTVAQVGQAVTNPTGTVVGMGVGAAVGALGPVRPGTGNASADAALGGLQDRAVGELQGRLEGKIQDQVAAKAGKLKRKVIQPAKKAGKIIARGAKKVITKVSKKLASRIGKTVIAKVMKQIAAKLALKFAAKAGAAATGRTLIAATVIGIPLAILLTVITTVAFTIETTIVAVLQGEEGVCPPGMSGVTDGIPGWLVDLIGFVPAVGELFSAIFPYMCVRTGSCNADEEMDTGLCYPKCEPGYDGVGPVCWTKNVGVGIGVLRGCPSGWVDDGLICRQPITLDSCPSDRVDHGLLCWKPISCRSVSDCFSGRGCGCSGGDSIHKESRGGRLIGKMNLDRDGGNMLACPSSHPDYIDGLCYKQCPLMGDQPYTVDRKYPIYIKRKITKNQDAVNKKRDENKFKNVEEYQKELINAFMQDDIETVKSNEPYIRNPEGPRDVDEPPSEWLKNGSPIEPEKPAGWPNQPPFMINQKFGPWNIMMPMPNPEFNKFLNYKTFDENVARFNRFIKKYPIPDPKTLVSDIPVFTEKITIDPRKRLEHIPGMPYQCMGARGISYGRGVGRSPIEMKPKIREPEPPPLPPPTFSNYFADDYATTACKVDYSKNDMLQLMCQFYYRSALVSTEETAEGTLSFEYISKITKVIASSEQSCDVICDITNLTINTDTGKTIRSSTTQNNDRRFYFAKLEKPCTFLPTAATNINNTAPDVKNDELGPANVNFTPTIDRCKDLPIQLKQCTNQKNINDMVKLYTSSGNIRVKQVIGATNEGTNTCVLELTESTYNPVENTESAPVKKIVNFSFQQTMSEDACLYKLDKFTHGYPTKVVPALAKAIDIEAPLPKESTLENCPTKCDDPSILRILIDSYNDQMKSTGKITSIRKAFTASPLRCDIEADVYNFKTKEIETQTIRFDMKKGTTDSCQFTVSKVGAAGSGTFVQNNTPQFKNPVNTGEIVVNKSDSVAKLANDTITGVKTKINQYLGISNTSFEKSLASVGQTLTLGDCDKKCSDPDVLQEIISHYNEVNYPRTRTNVTKKSIEKVLKAATSSRTTCDITFEEKREEYDDFYIDVPKVNMIQRTQRFKLKQMEDCKFVVDTDEIVPEEEAVAQEEAVVEEEAIIEEGFQIRRGLPGMNGTKKRV